MENPTRQVKRLLLRFPDDIILSNEKFSPDSKEGMIECEFIPIKSVWNAPNKVKYDIVENMVQWRVSVFEPVPRVVHKVTAPTSQNAAYDKLAKRLQGVSLNP